MITNLNNTGLIKPFLKYGVLGVLLATGLLVGTFTVSASDNVSCYDIVRQGMDVDYNGTGVFNSGKPIFDEIVVGAPGYSFQGCLEDAGPAFADVGNPAFGNPVNPYWQVKGWAWNDNLGWISMYCPPGAGAMNLGVACSQPGYTGGYGVTIDDQGYLHGYAWGDNTGWISFDNSPHSHIKIDVDKPECQGYVYSDAVGSNPDPVECPAQTKQQTMAWSDNVGWMDFDGVIFPWFQVTKMLTDAEVIVELIPDPNGKFKTAATIDGRPPLANDNVTGTDNYTVKVTIRDKDGLLLEEPRYQTTIDLMWAVDTVKKDQRKPAMASTHNLAAVPVCDDHANRAVTKPCTFTTANEYTGGGIWKGIIRSLAPTSNMNRLIRAGDSLVPEPPDVTVFEYEKFIAPANLSTPALESNTLILREAQISVLDTDNGLCMYGNDIITCSQRSRGFNNPPILSAEMKFLPQTEITTLIEDVNGDFIDVIVTEPQSFTIGGSVKLGATVTLMAGLDPVKPGLKMVFDTNGDGIVLIDELSSINVAGLLGGALTQIIAGVAMDPNIIVDQYLKGLHIYSVVDEGNGVYYYSNKLPRVIGSTGVQPVAILRGSVYSVGAATTTTTQGDVIRSLGDISTNLLRDQVFRNVSSLIAGASAQPANNLRLVEGQGALYGGFQPGEGSGIVYLLNDSADVPVPKVYFAKGDIHVGGIGDTVEWSGERTIVTIGGNIYIDANLYNAVASPRPKLGLIALKDLTSNSAAAQGHVYILNTVNNVQANIFADGSVFTYHNGVAFNPADGRPYYADEDAYQDISEKRQLFIEGSVASQNTIGGATRLTKVDGLGKAVGSTRSEILRAKQYDLNFLRMYTGLINRDASGNALTGGDPVSGDPAVPVASEAALKITTAAGLPWSRHMIPAGDLYPPFELNSDFVPALGLEELSDLGSTYIYYDPPSPTLPGFQGSSEFDISVTAG